MEYTMKQFFTSFFVVFIFSCFLFPQQQSTGTIEGFALDQTTQIPLISANVLVMNTAFGAVTDADGNFTINNVSAGSYSIQFRMIGYSTITKTDVIVRPARISTVSAELSESAVESEQVVVTAGYFQQNDIQSMNSVGFSREEIRRAPGSGGDVSRIIMSLPSLAKVNDQSNSLIVRGGSPLENAFYIDGIEIPNINHFPTQGATGGPIGMVNVDLIDEVNFHTGGFSPTYGDKLSSILDIRFREGNRKEFDGQLDLNIAGFGGVAEGPIGEHGSYLLSARRSYLEYVMKMFDVGTTVAPTYGDVQGKFVFDLSSNHKLSIAGLYGDDHNNPDLKAALENDMLAYGNQDIYQSAVGIVWRALWGEHAYSTTTVGYLSSKFNEDFFETNTGIHLIQNRSIEAAVSLRNINHVKFSSAHFVEFGIDIKRLMNEYDNFYGAFSNAVGDSTDAAMVSQNISANKVGGFFNYIVQPFGGLTLTIGSRADYFSINDRVTVSPRASLSYQINELTIFKMSSGVYYQNLPLLLISQNNANKSLKDPYAVHYIVGLDHLLSEDTRLNVEVYMKEYYDFPVDPADPSLFLVDEVFYRYGFFLNHGALSNSGKARSGGIEITLQKKLAEDFYGLASVTFFRTEYKGTDDIWRNRVFDNRFIVSAEGGYKPNVEWEFSARWIYAGGTPYTPFDLTQSAQLKRGVFEANNINGARYPAYHSMNVRFDKRFHFESSNLVLYLSAWNVYNQKNVAAYFWNEKENKQDTIYQWNLLPIFGVEYEL
jgi:outer membrane receptor for ferrienterochelin and colicin